MIDQPLPEPNWQIQLTQMIYEYLDWCKEKDQFPHKAGFRKWMRISGHNFIREKMQFDLVRGAINDLEDEGLDYLLQKGLKNKLNPVITKLTLSANFGMKERSDTTTNDKELPTPIYGGKPKDGF